MAGRALLTVGGGLVTTCIGQNCHQTLCVISSSFEISKRRLVCILQTIGVSCGMQIHTGYWTLHLCGGFLPWRILM